MKYPNAYAGVKKLFASQLLNLVAGVYYLAAALLALNYNILEGENNVLYVILVVAAIIAAVAGLASYVLQLVGLNQARKDERLFSKAFKFAILGVAVTVVLFLTAGMFAEICAGVNTAITLLVGVFTITGVYSLADALNDTVVQKRGKLTLGVLTGVFAVVMLSSLVTIFTDDLISDIFTIVCAALDIFGYLVFLTYLSMAKKMLANAN